MEPVKTPVTYTIEAKALKVEECFETLRVDKIGDEVMTQKQSLGWFVHFQGSHESIFFGDEKPDFAVDDIVVITFRRKG